MFISWDFFESRFFLKWYSTWVIKSEEDHVASKYSTTSFSLIVVSILHVLLNIHPLGYRSHAVPVPIATHLTHPLISHGIQLKPSSRSSTPCATKLVYLVSPMITKLADIFFNCEGPQFVLCSQYPIGWGWQSGSVEGDGSSHIQSMGQSQYRLTLHYQSSIWFHFNDGEGIYYNPPNYWYTIFVTRWYY